MARPRKNNADYFSHDNNMRNHRKIKALRNTYGFMGYSVWNMLLETLSECDNFKIKLKKDIDWELLSADFGCTSEDLRNIIKYCLDIELLEEKDELYFSSNLIERLSPLVEKREYLRNKYKEKVVSATETPISAVEMPHSKVNKSKVNKSKEVITSEQGSQVQEIMNIFFKINPTLNWGNKTYRKSCLSLIKRFGFEDTKRMSAAACQVMGKQYAPTATNPYIFEQKIADFKIYFDKQNNQPKRIIL